MNDQQHQITPPMAPNEEVAQQPVDLPRLRRDIFDELYGSRRNQVSQTDGVETQVHRLTDAIMQHIAYHRATERESLVDLEAAARALHDTNCGHLPQRDQDAIWRRDYDMLISRAKDCARAWGLQWRKSPEERP